MDIIVSQSTPVYAPADGYIYEIKSPSSNSLSYLIIIHNY